VKRLASRAGVPQCAAMRKFVDLAAALSPAPTRWYRRGIRDQLPSRGRRGCRRGPWARAAGAQRCFSTAASRKPRRAWVVTCATTLEPTIVWVCAPARSPRNLISYFAPRPPDLGTRSRADSVASTRASILSVSHANGARPLTLVASAINTSQPCSSSRSWTNRAVHRLDDPADRRPVHRRPGRRPAQAIGIGRRGPLVDDIAGAGEQADVDLASTQIQSSVQHEDGLLELAPRWTCRACHRGGPPSSHSKAEAPATAAAQRLGGAGRGTLRSCRWRRCAVIPDICCAALSCPPPVVVAVDVRIARWATGSALRSRLWTEPGTAFDRRRWRRARNVRAAHGPRGRPGCLRARPDSPRATLASSNRARRPA
jgi:hypothetical protein